MYDKGGGTEQKYFINRRWIADNQEARLGNTTKTLKIKLYSM